MYGLRCGRADCHTFVEVEPSWQWGSYCSEACAQTAFKALAAEAGADMPTPDEFLGIDAFRCRQPQMGATEGREHQFDDLNQKSILL